jgi:hypothetical protein
MGPPFAPHTTGHWHLDNGWLVRVDLMAGRWCASRLTPWLSVHDQFFGSDEQVHTVALAWAHKLSA